MKDTPLELLVVADHPDDIQLLEEAFLEMEEIRFSREWLRAVDRVYAMDAGEAIATAVKRDFDAALVDLDLGDKEGARAFQKLRERIPHLPVIVLAEPEEETLAMRLMKQGAQDYILKPELDCLPMARALHCAVVRQRVAAGRRSQALVDELTGMWNERGFGLVGRAQLGVAARCGLAALVVTAEARSSPGDVDLLEAADAFRNVLPESAVLGRLGASRFAAVVAPAEAEVIGRLERAPKARIKVQWTTLRPEPNFDPAAQCDVMAACENEEVAARAGRHI